MIIIGIHGKKGSGKDECYLAIKDFYEDKELSVERIAFGDALKREVSFNYRVSVDYIEQNKENFRLILQGHGTDYRRKLCGDTYWIKQVFNSIRVSKADVVVIPDVRFTNEVLFVRQMKGYLWKVTRPSSSIDTHLSETELDTFDKWDVEIKNDTTLKRFHTEVQFQLTMNNYALYSAKHKHT